MITTFLLALVRKMKRKPTVCCWQTRCLRTAWAWDSVTCWSQEYLISVQILIYIQYKVYIYIIFVYIIYYINIFFMYVQCACGMCVHACIYCRPLSRIQTFTTPGTAWSRSARTRGPRRSGESKEVRCHHVFYLLIVFSHSFSMSTCLYIYIILAIVARRWRWNVVEKHVSFGDPPWGW